jgi:hypothetical protein
MFSLIRHICNTNGLSELCFRLKKKFNSFYSFNVINYTNGMSSYNLLFRYFYIFPTNYILNISRLSNNSRTQKIFLIIFSLSVWVILKHYIKKAALCIRKKAGVTSSSRVESYWIRVWHRFGWITFRIGSDTDLEVIGMAGSDLFEIRIMDQLRHSA